MTGRAVLWCGCDEGCGCGNDDAFVGIGEADRHDGRSGAKAPAACTRRAGPRLRLPEPTVSALFKATTKSGWYYIVT